AHLEDQLAVAVVEDAYLGVGRLAVLRLHVEAPAQADRRPGQLILVQTPAGLVHLVDALVAQVAVAVVPHPVPVVMELLARQPLRLRRRAAPQVIVGRGRDLAALRRGRADAGPQLVAQAARQLDLAQLAGVQEGDGLAHAGGAAALGAGLADAAVLA